MKTPFSQELVRLRKGAGFTTAYKFFNGNGGGAALKLTYRSYLRAETGEVLPPLQKLGALIFALRLGHDSRDAKGLVTAWLKTMAGPDAYRDLLQPLACGAPAAAPPSPADAALKMARLKRTYYITPAQYAVISSCYGHFKCCHFITNSDEAWTPEAMAKAAGLGKAEALKALKDLARVKLIKEVKKGSYKCLVNHNIMALPDKRSLPPEQAARYAVFLDRLAGEGNSLLRRRLVLRADAHAFQGYLPSLDSALMMCDSYAVNSGTGATALYLVEGAVTRIGDY